MLHCKIYQRDSTKPNQVNLCKPMGRAGRAITRDETCSGVYEMRRRSFYSGHQFLSRQGYFQVNLLFQFNHVLVYQLNISKCAEVIQIVIIKMY